LSDEVVTFVQSGVAVTVATRDEDLSPAVTRGWGPAVSADGRALDLLIDAASGSQTRENLEGNGAIAVGFGLPTIARAVQLKGRVEAIRQPQPGELDRAERHLAAFAAETEQIGIPEWQIRTLFPPASSLVAVTFPIAEAFDQTPGPAAGQRL
jgi:hypothetical protein